MRWVLVGVGLVIGCGRIGFDARTTGDGDAAVDGSSIDATAAAMCPAVQCTNANGSTSCVAGQCVFVCTAGFASCDHDGFNGCEASTTANTSCGNCGTSCACDNGACISTFNCNLGYGNCDADNANGCETDLSSLTDCGGCGVTCSNPNGTTTCSSFTCVPTCNAGFGDCGAPNDGCETNLLTSDLDCGSCGYVCAGTTHCMSGNCL
jgi:hypothetical protein